MLRAAALTLACAVLAFTAAACGQSSGSGGDADPASLAPAGAAVYAQVAVQPTGDRRDDALAAAGKLLRTDDPAGKLRAEIDKALAEEGDGFTWEKDFAPWLGENAGVWASNLEADEPDYAVIVATKDADAAKDALERFKQADEDTGPYTKQSHDGVAYEVDAEDTAIGLVGDFLVIGTENGFKRTADMDKGGDSLADADRYKSAVDDLEDDSLGHYFVDFKSIIAAATKADPEAAKQLEQAKAFFPVDKLGPMTGSFQADGDGMSIDTMFTGLPEGPFRDLAAMWSGSESELLAELPGDAWAAFATPKLGESAKTLFNSFAGALGGAAITAQVQQATGLNLEQDVFSWVGDIGVFARGTTQADLNGALVISTTDDAKADAAFGKLVGLIGKQSGTKVEPIQLDGAEAAFAVPAPGAPQQVILARGEGRVVAAFGEQAAKDALAPSAKLGDSESSATRRTSWATTRPPSCSRWTRSSARRRDGRHGRRLSRPSPTWRRSAWITSGGVGGRRPRAVARRGDPEVARRPRVTSDAPGQGRDERGGDEQQHGRHEQERDDELDLRGGARRCSAARRAWRARASSASAASAARAARPAGRRGAGRRQTACMPARRAAALEAGQRGVRRDAERDAPRGRAAARRRARRDAAARPRRSARHGPRPAATATRSRSSTSACSASMTRARRACARAATRRARRTRRPARRRARRRRAGPARAAPARAPRAARPAPRRASRPSPARAAGAAPRRPRGRRGRRARSRRPSAPPSARAPRRTSAAARAAGRRPVASSTIPARGEQPRREREHAARAHGLPRASRPMQASAASLQQRRQRREPGRERVRRAARPRSPAPPARPAPRPRAAARARARP